MLCVAPLTQAVRSQRSPNTIANYEFRFQPIEIALRFEAASLHDMDSTMRRRC